MKNSRKSRPNGRKTIISQMTGAQRASAYCAMEAAFAYFGREFTGRKLLARHLGLSDRACCAWLVTCCVPASRVLAVELATGVRRDKLRPDLYPPDVHPASR